MNFYMKGRSTSTSAFGVGRREAHDSSAFYGSKLYCDAGFPLKAPLKELENITVPPPGDWVDQLYCHTDHGKLTGSL